MSELTGPYNRYFDVVRADTPELLDAVYRLRYQVYCVDNRYEDPARCCGERETDDDDDRSVHTLLIHRGSGVAAGTARVIMLRLDKERPLPVQRLLGECERKIFGRLPLDQTGEISRFAVSRAMRRRINEESSLDFGFLKERSTFKGSERRSIPHITFGLLQGILETCLEYQISVLVAVMEPALLRTLARLGLRFEAIGPSVDYHGLRQPCVAEIATLLKNSRDQATLLWKYLAASGSIRTPGICADRRANIAAAPAPIVTGDGSRPRPEGSTRAPPITRSP